MSQIKVLYKYRAIGQESTAQREYARRMIEMGEFYFAPPSTFNDTFEGFPELQLPSSLESLRNLCSQWPQIKLEHKSMDFDTEIQNNFREYVNSVLIPHFQTEFLQRCDKTFGVLCASESHDNIQQWSYYADSHQGFCVAFEPPTDGVCIPIRYSQSRPKIDFSESRSIDGSQRSAVISVLQCKDSGWQHEKEVRVLIEPPPGVKKMGECIRAIYLGCRMRDADEELVRSWVANSAWREVPVIRMYREPEGFGLHSRVPETSLRVSAVLKRINFRGLDFPSISREVGALKVSPDGRILGLDADKRRQFGLNIDGRPPHPWDVDE